MRTEILCISVLRVASGPRVKLASCKSALNPRWFALLIVIRWWSRCQSYSLLLCGLFYEAICCMSFHVSFCSCVSLCLVWKGLRFVIVALPGLFSYLFSVL